MPLDADSVDDDPESYGSKGQAWNADFVAYMKFIVLHPNYAGMPDAVKDDGKIQWEAPSNRSGGRYKDTHHKRRDWWRSKAAAIGVSVAEDQWISRAAKTIHPTGQKPCKRCGTVLRLACVYPSKNFTARCTSVFGPELTPEPLEAIDDYVSRLVQSAGPEVFAALPLVLETASSPTPPSLGSLSEWLRWLKEKYIPSEPVLLSPGAMSNAPDRFDGFHSFNRCCRGVADTGRHAANLKSYTTDRRVFEYWSEGNWIAADRMMGVIKSQFGDQPTADGGDGPPTADHIGPLSLGFTHRPEFRLLSKAANSAKNNRMSLRDVEHLRERERAGEQVVSWYAQPVWDLLKHRVTNDETALRLSKIMRDNQRQAIGFLAALRLKGHATFLASLLELNHADFDVDFEDLRIENFVTRCELTMSPRGTKYAAEQKARRLRVGFEALAKYASKKNRHFKAIVTPKIEASLDSAFASLRSRSRKLQLFDAAILGLVEKAGTKKAEESLREICGKVPRLEAVPRFVLAKTHLRDAMKGVAAALAAMWNDERYVREEFAFDD